MVVEYGKSTESIQWGDLGERELAAATSAVLGWDEG